MSDSPMESAGERAAHRAAILTIAVATLTR